MQLAPPEEVGLSRAALHRIDELWSRAYVEPGKIAGVLTLIARRGRVVWLSPLGLRDRERQKPMRADTVFRIYSMTKPIVSVALMMLHERGVFALADPVHKWIPAFEKLRVYRYGRHPNFVTDAAERPMTIRDLLTHTSGLSYSIMERGHVDEAYRTLGVADGNGTLSGMIDKVAALPLEFSPGTRWGYSIAADVVGHLVELMSGQPLDAYLKEKIFTPLGMVDTGFTVPPETVDRFAANYERVDKKSVLFDDPESSRYARPRTFLSGGSGLVSTASDYFRFAEMLRRGGELDGARILGPRTIAYMTRNHLPGGKDLGATALPSSFSETRYEGVGFGLGFYVTLDPVRAQVPSSAGEYGWGGMASTAFFVDPAEELVVVFMTQLIPSTTFNFRGQLKSIVYGAITS